MTEINPLNDLIFDPYGSCIYCGTERELTDEHIVAHGLGGSAVLPMSSCKNCAAITGRDEQFVLRGPMWPVRRVLKLPSRNPKDAPTELPLKLVRNGTIVNVVLPIERHPLMLYFPKFSPPGIISGEHSDVINLKGLFYYNFGKRIEKVLADEGAEDIQYEQYYKFVPFAKMIAKIGWSMAAAQGELNKITKDDCVLPALLGKNNNIGYWVGTHTDPIVTHPGTLHFLGIIEDRDKGFLRAEVKLFSNSQTPIYGVVLGRLK